MISASVGFQCPDCVRGGAGTGQPPGASRPRTVAGGTVVADPRLVTKILVVINLAVFIAVHVDDALLDRLVLVAAWPPASLPPDQGVAAGEWYRLVTSMFTHNAVWHIGFNMLGLWWLGGPLEAHLGRVRYLALYFLSGLVGSATAYAFAAPGVATLGASGAIFGLLGATAVLMRELDYDLRPVIGLLALNLLFTFTWRDISWQAHIGGLVGGFVIGYAMIHAPRERRALIQYGACALVLAIVLGVVLVRTAQLT
ncbi:rhomboid family intramembrane serine protease [Streptomyces sp. NPDC046939]|uniref:rhomboid family intramembrane serine protease n=1 Tax=Streptomyces sp. NPDC046939 TaxID=3155376 RepID=UPI0033F83F87